MVPDRPLYLSNRSVAEGIRLGQSLVRNGAAAAGAQIIPLDEAIRHHLVETDALFFDKWHFAPAGHALAGQFIAPYMRRAPRPFQRDVLNIL